MTPSHEVERCAPGLQKVDNVNIVRATCLFTIVLVKSREAYNAFSENSSPQGAVIVDGRIGAIVVGS